MADASRHKTDITIIVDPPGTDEESSIKPESDVSSDRLSLNSVRSAFRSVRSALRSSSPVPTTEESTTQPTMTNEPKATSTLQPPQPPQPVSAFGLTSNLRRRPSGSSHWSADICPGDVSSRNVRFQLPEGISSQSQADETGITPSTQHQDLDAFNFGIEYRCSFDGDGHESREGTENDRALENVSHDTVELEGRYPNEENAHANWNPYRWTSPYVRTQIRDYEHERTLAFEQQDRFERRQSRRERPGIPSGLGKYVPTRLLDDRDIRPGHYRGTQWGSGGPWAAEEALNEAHHRNNGEEGVVYPPRYPQFRAIYRRRSVRVRRVPLNKSAVGSSRAETGGQRKIPSRQNSAATSFATENGGQQAVKEGQQELASSTILRDADSETAPPINAQEARANNDPSRRWGRHQPGLSLEEFNDIISEGQKREREWRRSRGLPE